jgi:cyclic pyranopterin monophosphate synthase
MRKLSHFDEEGRARMVSVGDKPATRREAVASGRVTMRPETLRRIVDREIEKGDALGVARVAGIMAAKRTDDLIPLCHPLAIDSVHIDFSPDHSKSELNIQSRVVYTGKTGVEMEALTAVAVTALTIYDMCKAVDRGMIIGEIKLMKKSGGKSGTFLRQEG